MNWFTLYVLTVLPNIGVVFAIVGTLAAFLTGGLLFFLGVTHDDISEYWSKERVAERNERRKAIYGRAKSTGVIAAIMIAISTLIPSRNEIIFIVGGSTLIEAAKSDRVKGIADQSLSVVEKWLKQQTAEEKKQ